jgi:hypothetical protein
MPWRTYCLFGGVTWYYLLQCGLGECAVENVELAVAE